MGRGSAPNALRPLRVCDKEAALGPAGSSSFPKSGRVQLVFILEQVLIGVAIERLLFRRFYRSDPILSLLLTFGLAMVIEQGLRIVFGAAPLPFSIPPELRGQIFVGDFIYSRYRLIILAVAVAAVTATWFIVYRTAFGRVVRAGVQNPDVVGALGISLAPYMPAIAALGGG